MHQLNQFVKTARLLKEVVWFGLSVKMVDTNNGKVNFVFKKNDVIILD